MRDDDIVVRPHTYIHTNIYTYKQTYTNTYHIYTYKLHTHTSILSRIIANLPFPVKP